MISGAHYNRAISVGRIVIFFFKFYSKYFLVIVGAGKRILFSNHAGNAMWEALARLSRILSRAQECQTVK